MPIEELSAEWILFFIIYGTTGAMPLFAAVYLLLRRGNAFAADVTPPMRLRRWAAAFFIVAALGHVWWYLFFIFSHNIHSASYVVTGLVDCVGLLTTIAGTLLAMLQDRKRPVWPVVAALIPYVGIGVLYIVHPVDYYMYIAIAYIMVLYALFSIYMVFAVRRYGRWLRDNYADLERKEVWLSQAVSLVCLLLFILYTLVDTDATMFFALHFVELVLFSLLLWRVETLPTLEETLPLSVPVEEECDDTQEEKQEGMSLDYIEQLLEEHCVDTQLYLQHDLTLHQLAQAIGTNRSYLSLYFSRQGTTYNAYISDLRVNHFMILYRNTIEAHQSITAQQLAGDCGYNSYSTFSLAFKQRTGLSVMAWMRQTTEDYSQNLQK